MSKFYIMTKDWSRHGNYSGYEKLINYYNLPIQNFRLINLPFRLNEYFKLKTQLVNYKSETIVKELIILVKILSKKNIHILYGDMDYYFLHYIKMIPFNFRSNKLIATFHHPPNELENRLGYNRKKVLGALDKIIVMGPNQIPFFKQYTKASIKFIPHGIDTDYFKPKKNDGDWKNEILIIGISHRDHQRNIEIIKEVNNLKLNIVFIVIMIYQYAKLYKGLNNINIRTNKISDEKLLKYYQTSKGVLLSLIDCTASNTILEALSTGCPLITNNVGAVKDYVPERSGVRIFETNEIKESAEFIKLLITNEKYLEGIASKQRSLAMQYDWKNIVKLTETFILS